MHSAGDLSRFLSMPLRKEGQATLLSSSETVQGYFFPPAVYTPLTQIFRRLFKWELKYDCLIKMKSWCIFNWCRQTLSKSFCSAICIHKILTRKTRCTFKKHMHKQAASQEHRGGENIWKILFCHQTEQFWLYQRDQRKFALFEQPLKEALQGFTAGKISTACS